VNTTDRKRVTQEAAEKVLTKTAYEHLVAAVGKMLEEGKKAGQQADSSLAKIYWTCGNKLMEAGLIGRDHYGESVIDQLAEDFEINAQTIRRAVFPSESTTIKSCLAR
jgi:hypothetical protein